MWNRKKNTSKEKFDNWIPSWASIKSEADVHPHVPDERAELFSVYNAGTTEIEVLNWLHATVMVLKPDAVLETGAANGLGTIALASACKNNGFGKVHSVELDAALCRELESKIKDAGLSHFVEVHCADSRDFFKRNSTVFDIGFFDSMSDIRAEEFSICLERGKIRNLAVFHDTSPLRCESLKGWPSDDLHIKYMADLRAFAEDPRCTGYFESRLSRGFVSIYLKKH